MSEKMIDENVAHVMKMLMDLTKTLRNCNFADTWEALEKLSPSDMNELRENIRLVRGFINNV